jgi:hypothetical protein
LKKLAFLLPAAALALAPLVASPASAQTTVIKKYGHGGHHGWRHGGARKVVVIKKQRGGPMHRGVVTKKVIHRY